MNLKVSVIFAAAGSGERAKQSGNKIFSEVCGIVCIKKTFDAFYSSGLVDEYIVAAKPEEIPDIEALLPDCVKFSFGGKTRTESVKNALAVTTGDVVLIHDAARPFVSHKIIKEFIESAHKFGSGVAARPTRDTVAEKTEKNTKYLGKNGLYLIHAGSNGTVGQVAAVNATGLTLENTANKLSITSAGATRIIVLNTPPHKVTVGS